MTSSIVVAAPDDSSAEWSWDLEGFLAPTRAQIWRDARPALSTVDTGAAFIKQETTPVYSPPELRWITHLWPVVLWVKMPQFVRPIDSDSRLERLVLEHLFADSPRCQVSDDGRVR